MRDPGNEVEGTKPNYMKSDTLTGLFPAKVRASPPPLAVVVLNSHNTPNLVASQRMIII